MITAKSLQRLTATAGVFLVLTFVPSAFAGGSSFSITEVEPHSRVLTAGQKNQNFANFDVVLYNSDIAGLKNMSFDFICEGGEGIEKITVVNKGTEIGSANLQDFADASATNGVRRGADVETTNTTVTNEISQSFSVEVDVSDNATTKAGVCRLNNFHFTDSATSEPYGQERSVEYFNGDLTPFMIINPSNKPVSNILSATVTGPGETTLRPGTTNQLLHRVILKSKEPVVINDIFFTCGDLYSAVNFTIKNRTDGIKRDGVPIYGVEYYDFQPAVFSNLHWEITPDKNIDVGIYADMLSDSWSINPTSGCSIRAINATTKADSSAVYSTKISGIGEENETGPFIVTNIPNDLQSSNRFYDALLYLYQNSIMTGYPDGTIRPDALVNRAELAKMITLAHRYSSNSYLTTSPICSAFPDVERSEWYVDNICRGYNQGWLKGYPDGTFHPSNNVTRAEAVKMVLTGFELSDAAETTSVWYEYYKPKAEQFGLLFNDDQFTHPADQVSRGELAQMIYLAVNGKQGYEDPFVSTPEFDALMDELHQHVHKDNINADYTSVGVVFDYRLECTQETYDLFEKVSDQIDEQQMNQESFSFSNPIFLEWAHNNSFYVTTVMFELSPLAVASNSGCVDIAQHYIDEGVDIDDTQGYGGKSALHVAADNGDNEMVKLLLENGADPDNLTKEKLLYASAVENHSTLANMTPLMFAVGNGYTTVAKTLLDADADPNIDGPVGRRALDFTTNTEMMNLLKEYGATKGTLSY